jgi:DNA processing protein
MEGFFDERTCLCALNRIFGYSPRTGRELCTAAGSARAVFSIPKEELVRMLGEEASLAEKVGPAALEAAVRELEGIARKGGRFLSIEDEGYPEILLECPDPPLGLYLRSESPPGLLFDFRPAVAVVGTRKVTPYGDAWCRRIVETLASVAVKPVIVSGLAFGTDRIAHETALRCGLPTIGVMATGIDDIYPWQHRPLAERMSQEEGCALLTDYPTGTAPVALNFMRRNRIIAGLARATVVIESGVKGGSLITARYANEYSRDVFALPGRLDDPFSAGCNNLIMNRMADIIADPDSLAERLGLTPVRPRRELLLKERIEDRFSTGCTPEERRFLLEIAGKIDANRGITAEGLAALTGRPYPEIVGAVTRLSAEGIVATDLLQRCSIVK